MQSSTTFDPVYQWESDKLTVKRSTALERSVKYFTGGLKPVSRRQLTLNLDVDQDTYKFGLHKRPLTYECIIS